MIDWMPTLMQFFGQSIPDDVQGQPLDNVIRFDAPNREYAMYGAFSGHANITDGKYCYMRAPLPEKRNEIYNYTLMPTHMTNRFSPEELRDAQLRAPFSFTKGCSVLKVKAKDAHNVGRFGTLLFDLEKDPGQTAPIHNQAVEDRMIELLKQAMDENDCPPEQYERLGLN